MNLPLPWIDVLVLAVLLFFILRNAWIGFWRGLSSLLGLVAGYLACLRLGGMVEKIMAPWLPEAWLKFAAYAAAFMLGFLAVFILAELLTGLFKKARLSWLDHLLGAFLGGVKGLLFWSVLFILVTTFYPGAKKYFAGSYTYPYLMKSARFLADIFPSQLKARFNYNLRHFLSNEK